MDSKKRVNDSSSSIDNISTKKMKTMEEQTNPLPFSIDETFQRRVNKDFLKYYKEQNLFDNDDEWNQFLKYLHIDLPTTFRITNRHNLLRSIYPGFTSRDVLTKLLKELFSKNNDLNFDIEYRPYVKVTNNGESTSDSNTDEYQHIQSNILNNFTLNVNPPKPIEWYPFELAWHFDASKKFLRTSPSLKHFKHFLNVESNIGNISRQESVSMIPPLLLDIQKDHVILDMCASPGSKSCQIIEILNSHKDSNSVFIANDIDITRSYLLTHQLQRLGSKNLIVTNMDAKQFRDIKIVNEKNEETILKFDRILCDVPCSGDGTIRKSPLAGSRWEFSSGKKLHSLQLSIARRGCQMLKVGGIFVYSTCAINPIENEAVVAQLLREGKGSLELVDVSDKLPQLKCRPGLNTWKVFESYKTVYGSYEEVKHGSLIRKSMFPPSTDENFNLERCIRIYPHLQNTGSFFIAVIRKVGEFIGDEDTELISEDESNKKKKGRIFSDDPFLPLPEHIKTEIINEMFDSYGIPKDNPIYDNMLVRSPKNPDEIKDYSDVNTIYTCSPLCYNIVKHNNPKELNIINAGLKILENDRKRNKKANLQCKWRISDESLHSLLPFISKRIVKISMKDFKMLIQRDTPKAPFLSEFEPSAKEQLESLEGIHGGFVFVVENEDKIENYTPIDDKSTSISIELKPDDIENYSLDYLLKNQFIAFLGWKGTNSAAHHIDKLKLLSYRNQYLTPDYSFNFDPTIRKVNEEAKRQSIEKSRLKKKEIERQKLERKNMKKEMKKKKKEENVS